MIRSLYTAVTVQLVAVAPAVAQSADIEQVIRDQITAFQADDFPKAFTYASPMIQGMFGDAKNFGRMVRQGYPMVHRPKSLVFRGLDQNQSGFVQTVLIEDQAGRMFLAKYEMIQTKNGWKINGVYIVPDTTIGA